MEHRGYRDEDYLAVCDFFIALNKADHRHIHFNWAWWEWMYEHPWHDRSLKPNIGLWIEGDAVVGLATYDLYFGEGFVGCLPSHKDLFPEIVRYGYDRLKDEKGFKIYINPANQEEVDAVLAEGFQKENWRETVMEADLSEPLVANVPVGMSIEPFDYYESDEALDQFQWLIWQGFDHGDDRGEMEKEGLPDGMKKRVHFDPRLSLVAKDADGNLIGYCCLWYIDGTGYAYVEPVCVIPAWRGSGVGMALVRHGLNVVRELGAKQAYVIADSPFYEKVGFRKTDTFVLYHKK